ncbi:MAG: Ig-like domain-containing protein [Candidatus Hatepunaea meridiana]|nr:Ig-like domain-containing protein [Candidatus Hatepunaea meridiana]
MSFELVAIDVDREDRLTIDFAERSGLPEAAEIDDIGDGTATFLWLTTFADEGEYNLVFSISDGEDIDNDDLSIILINEEELPEAIEIHDNGNGTGSFSWMTTFADAGEYSLILQLSDGEMTDITQVFLLVRNINRRPQVANFIPDIELNEDSDIFEIADLDTIFIDPDDDDEFDFSIEHPDGLIFDVTEDNILSIQTEEDFYGENLEVTVMADDGREDDEWLIAGPLRSSSVGVPACDLMWRQTSFLTPRRDLTVTDQFLVTINPINDPPVWDEFPQNQWYEVEEDELAVFELVAQDEVDNNDELTIELVDRGGLPDEAELEDNDDGTAEFSWQTDFDDAGEFHPVFTVSDDEEMTELLITIVVININRPPIVVDPIDDIEIEEDSGALEVADLDDVFEDTDGDELSFTTIEGIDELNLSIEDDTNVLTLEPSQDYFGDSEVIIEADDGQDQARMVMNFTNSCQPAGVDS